MQHVPDVCVCMCVCVCCKCMCTHACSHLQLVLIIRMCHHRGGHVQPSCSTELMAGTGVLYLRPCYVVFMSVEMSPLMSHDHIFVFAMTTPSHLSGPHLLLCQNMIFFVKTAPTFICLFIYYIIVFICVSYL